MDAGKLLEKILDVKALEILYVKMFEEALEEINDEAIKNALKLLANLSKIRYMKAHLNIEGVSLEHDFVIEPILEKLAEERKLLDRMK